ncbi:MAG: hypothetical protein ACREA2_07240 [Blastocatellia bacterium]
MFRIRTTFSLAIFAFLSVNLAFAQSQNAPGSVNITPSQEFRFISTKMKSTFEKELNDLARQGFQFARLANPFDRPGLGGLLAREKEGEGRKYEYKVLATTRLGTMKKELEAAAAEGFESRGIATTIAVLERPVGESKRRFDYKFVSMEHKKEAQKELDAAVSEGYVPVEMVMSNNRYSFAIAIVLARDANNPGAEMGKREYRFMETANVSRMEKEMNKLAKEGFQFHLTSNGLIMIMSRPLKEKTQKYEYKLLATMRSSTMQKELTDTGVQGYQFLGITGELVMVMERGVDVSGRQYEYKLLGTALESTTQKELSEAVAGGYKFLAIKDVGERVIVMGRRKEATAEAK